MSELFLKFLNISITAGWLVLAILLMRTILKKAPKWINCMMWGIVGVRLIFPFSIESIFSLIPSIETVSKEIFYEKYPTVQSGSITVDSIVNPVLSTFFEATPQNSANPIQIFIAIAANLWVLGTLVMIGYAFFSYLFLEEKLREATHLKENIWKCDYVDPAFVFGLFRPRIYISSSLKETQLEYVIAHERAHIKRKDYLWKPIGFCLLAVYWFHPLIWIAYITLCKDIEYACDEYVIKHMQIEEKKAYSMALLECTTLRKMIYVCPVAFGELNVERRVKTVLSYKKPALWISFISIVICVVFGVGFLTEPMNSDARIERRDYEMYVIERYPHEENYLTLLPDGKFIMEDNIDPNTYGGYSVRGIYEQDGNYIILQFSDSDEKYELVAKGDELIFEDTQTASSFISDTWNVWTEIESDRFVKQSTYTLLERDWPEEFVEAMDDATKEKLAESKSFPASTYWSYYFDQNGNSEGIQYGTAVSYNEIENIDDYVLKLNLMVVPVGHTDYGEGYYESNLDGVNVFCTYEWLQPPSTFGKEYKMWLKWHDGFFKTTENGFLKIDKYDTKDGEYIRSYEPAYARHGSSELLWYTDIKGTLGIDIERLYGCAIVAMEEVRDVGALNINFFLEYEVNGREYQAVEEFSWKPVRVEGSEE